MLARLPDTGAAVVGALRTFSPSWAFTTRPDRWAGAQVTAQAELTPFQLAVMVTDTALPPGWRLVTWPSGETAAAAGLLLVQVMEAPSR